MAIRASPNMHANQRGRPCRLRMVEAQVERLRAGAMSALAVRTAAEPLFV